MTRYADNLPTVSSSLLEQREGLCVTCATGEDFTGSAEQYYFSEKNPFEILSVKKTSEFLGGRLDGSSKSYFKDGTLAKEEIYSAGELLKFYFNQGCLFESSNGIIYLKPFWSLKEGVRFNEKRSPFNGESRSFDEKGRLREVTQIVNGMRSGNHEVFYVTGELKESRQYRENYLHGLYECYQKNGKVFYSSIFRCGYTKLYKRPAGRNNPIIEHLANEAELKMYLNTIAPYSEDQRVPVQDERIAIPFYDIFGELVEYEEYRNCFSYRLLDSLGDLGVI